MLQPAWQAVERGRSRESGARVCEWSPFPPAHLVRAHARFSLYPFPFLAPAAQARFSFYKSRERIAIVPEDSFKRTSIPRVPLTGGFAYMTTRPQQRVY